jgi:transcription elongation factor GreB
MSRYRPPQRAGSRYITAEGMAALRAELHQLWKVERPQVTAVVHEAAKNGDRSENGDYIYGKRRLREIDRRVRYLSRRIDEVEVVGQLPADQSKIYFGAWVTVEDEDGSEQTYRIVGPDEFDLKTNRLSMDAPLARALLGKRVGDDTVFNSPSGERELYIVAVSYAGFPPLTAGEGTKSERRPAASHAASIAPRRKSHR